MKTTIEQWVNHFRSQFISDSEFLENIDFTISELEKDKDSQAQLKFYKRVRNKYHKLFGNKK